ncbi:MAG: response regulator [Clostridia bacterium]|nr:response regulator [Clostridia bacterium]
MELIEDSGKSLLNLINQTLDYQNETELYDTTKSLEVPKQHADSKLQEKNHLYAVLKGSRILLCEDQHINAEITRKLLERMGSEVIIAENGQAGLELFKQSKYGEFKAILMDIRMPVMDGIEATVRIRSLAREDAATIPIVAVTANSYDEDQKATKDAGMNAHLTKPVAPEQLYITLAQLIQENS